METSGIGREEFLALLVLQLTPKNLERVEAAYAFSKGGHRNQERDSGTRYFEHPKSVALILIQELDLTNWRLVVTALLHDLLEDTFLMTPERVRRNFGARVARWVNLLSKRAGIDYHAELMATTEWQPLMVKLCDRLHNLRTLGSCSPEKQSRKRRETREYYLPMAERLMQLVPDKHSPQVIYLASKIAELAADPV